MQVYLADSASVEEEGRYFLYFVVFVDRIKEEDVEASIFSRMLFYLTFLDVAVKLLHGCSFCSHLCVPCEVTLG